MIVLNPSDTLDLSFALKKAVKLSGLTPTKIIERLKQDYGVEISTSALSHNLTRQGIGLKRALQILAVCWVGEVEIKALSGKKEKQDGE